MSRTIQEIQTAINLQVTTDPILGPQLTSTSQTAIWNLESFITATSIALFEQLQDIYKTQLEAEIAAAAPGTPQWVVEKMLAFQYSTQTPQVIVFSNGIPGYQVINPSLQIIQNCAVITSPNTPGTAKVLVAQSDTTTPLTQGVQSITITNAGSGYTVAPSYQFISGGYNSGGATLTMQTPPYTVGQVITTTSQGAGYTQVPNIQFTGGGPGNNGQLSAVVNINSQLAAAQAYMDVIGFTGIQYNLVSLANDWLTIDAQIQFNGQYTFTTIQTAVENAISGYLSNLPFDGIITLSDLIVAIKSVPGVIDLEFTSVIETDNAGGNTQTMVAASAIINPQVGTSAGTALFKSVASVLTYTTNPL